MTEKPYRAGILCVSKGCPGVPRALPPEHRVAAIADLPDWRAEDWLVEGSTLPVVPASGVPERVNIRMTATQVGRGIRLDARWDHESDAQPWLVGQWPHFAAFERDFRGSRERDDD